MSNLLKKLKPVNVREYFRIVRGCRQKVRRHNRSLPRR